MQRIEIMKTENKFKKSLFAFIAAVCFLYYIYAEFFTGNSVSAVLRAGVLLSGCIMSTFSALEGNKALEREAAEKNMRRVFFVFFVLYVAFVLNITLLDSFYGRSSHFILKSDKREIEEYVSSSVNLVPLKTVRLYMKGYASDRLKASDFALNIFGNLAAFMPFGLFLPLYFPKMRRAGGFLRGMLLIVFGIEGLQLLCMSGAFDVDDIILNVGGAFLFFGLTQTKGFREKAQKIYLRY